jgi:hypothetical protein
MRHASFGFKESEFGIVRSVHYKSDMSDAAENRPHCVFEPDRGSTILCNLPAVDQAHIPGRMFCECLANKCRLCINLWWDTLPWCQA